MLLRRKKPTVRHWKWSSTLLERQFHRKVWEHKKFALKLNERGNCQVFFLLNWNRLWFMPSSQHNENEYKLKTFYFIRHQLRCWKFSSVQLSEAPMGIFQTLELNLCERFCNRQVNSKLKTNLECFLVIKSSTWPLGG